MRRLLGSLLVLHGFAHAAAGIWATPVGPTWFVTLLWFVAMVGFVAAGAGLIGVRKLDDLWLPIATTAAVASILLIARYPTPATLVGSAQAWDYLLVWSPRGIVLRASLACDKQESNIVLTQNRFAHVCFQDANYVVAGTVKPLGARVALKVAGTTQVALAATEGGVAGSAGTTVWRFDASKKRKLRTYTRPAIVVDAGGGRFLVDRDARSLEVLDARGRVVTRVRARHEGGAALAGARVATIDGRTLRLGARRYTVAAGARLEDVATRYAVYAVETQLHLLRLRDGRDVRLRLRGQFGYAHARLAGDALYCAYNGRAGRLGHAGYLAPAAVRTLFG